VNFVKGAEVFSATGESIGTISRVVIDAKTRDVTDLVVERGALFKDEKVVPVGLVDLEREDRITLRETNQSVDDLPGYETTHYVRADLGTGPYENVETAYWYPPVGFQMQLPNVGVHPAFVPDEVPVTETSIPEGRIVISEGAKVISADDEHVGNVEQVVVDAGNMVSHFVIGKGFLLREHKLVPAFWVSSVDDDRVRLSVESHLFDRLPDYHPDEG
jgi:uncharacterized protein YrrD